MTATFKFLLPMLSACLMALAGGQANATFLATPTQTFNFSGDCADCDDYGPGVVPVTATLVLRNYNFGGGFNLSNIVSFTYGGSNLFAGFTWNAGDLSATDGDVTGYFAGPNLNDLGHQVHLTTNVDPNNNLISFFQASANIFTLGTYEGPAPAGDKDNGTGTWSTTHPIVNTDPNPIPEPGSLLLVGGALVALGLARRRRG